MPPKRISWIDTARGIGIIFVIYAHGYHVLGKDNSAYLFYAFHIPFFFFLSGVVFKHYDRFLTIVKKSFKSLLVPYFIFALLMYAAWLFHLSHTSNFDHREAVRQFLGIFYGNTNDGLLVFNDVLWFLPTLFATKLLFALVMRLSKKTRNIFLALFLFSVYGYLFSIFASTIKLPFGVEIAYSAVVFYGAGFLWNRSERAKALITHHTYLLFPLLLLVGSVLATIDFRLSGYIIDMREDHLHNYFFFYIDAFLGIFAWIAFSMLIKRNALLETVGKNSLILFAWHPIVFIYITQVFNRFLSSPVKKEISFLVPLLYTIISMSVILAIHFLFKKIIMRYFSMRRS